MDWLPLASLFLLTRVAPVSSGATHSGRWRRGRKGNHPGSRGGLAISGGARGGAAGAGRLRVDRGRSANEGLAVHCAQGSAVCATANGGVKDVLPGEPGGYHGYQALYGNKFIQPVISPSGPVRNLDGQVIQDSSGDIGFPGYDGMTGPNALAYTLDMQLHGVSVTDTYLSDLHDSWTGSGPFGPGEAGYEA